MKALTCLTLGLRSWSPEVGSTLACSLNLACLALVDCSTLPTAASVAPTSRAPAASAIALARLRPPATISSVLKIAPTPPPRAADLAVSTKRPRSLSYPTRSLATKFMREFCKPSWNASSVPPLAISNIEFLSLPLPILPTRFRALNTGRASVVPTPKPASSTLNLSEALASRPLAFCVAS